MTAAFRNLLRAARAQPSPTEDLARAVDASAQAIAGHCPCREFLAYLDTLPPSEMVRRLAGSVRKLERET